MTKKIVVLLVILASTILAQPVKWNPQTQKVWDVDQMFNQNQIKELEQVINTAPVQTRLIIIRDFQPESLGKTWNQTVTMAKATSDKPLDFSPANSLLGLIVDKYRVGECSPGAQQSLVILATAIRGDPKKRLAISVSEPTHQKVREPEFGNAYLEFAKAIGKQGNTLPATPESMVAGLKAGLPALFDMLR
jgi:hypothetical protein